MTLEEICRTCDISPEIAKRAIENLIKRGLIKEVKPPQQAERRS
jgi:hypothetical protein